MHRNIPIFLLFMLFFSVKGVSQNPTMTNYNTNTYESDWKEIEQLEGNGLPKSALKKIEEIYRKAKADKNPSQTIKTFIYRAKYEMDLEEEGFAKAIDKLKKETDEAEFPVQPILQSMMGELYKSYLNANIYNIQNRTATLDFKNEDIRTWSVAQLSKESAKYYLASLQDDRLQTVNIADFDAIRQKSTNPVNVRPTLYDFLAHRAIDYFANERNFLTEPAYKFVIDQENAFASAEKFAVEKFTTRDSTSNKYFATSLFQELIKKNISEKPTPALMDLDIKRIQFVRNNAVMENKDSLYLQALEAMREKYQSAEILYLLATYHRDKGQNYQPNPDSVGKWELREAVKLCDEGIALNKNGRAGANCLTLKMSILQKTLQVQTELVNLPNKSFLAKIDYQNLSQMHFKIIKFSEKLKRELEKKQEYQEGRDGEIEAIKFLNSLEPVKAWSVELLDEKDYRSHGVEVLIDKLPLGIYMLFVSVNEAFTLEKNAVAFALTHVSNIAFLHRQDELKLPEFIVTDRTTGEPLPNLTTEIFVQQYDPTSRRNEFIKEGNAVTNKDGFMYPRLKPNKYYTLKFINGKDTLHLQDGFSQYYYKQERQKYNVTHFFLDRSIYRPGQTIFFKGLVVEMDEKNMPHVQPSLSVTVTFTDANGQKIEDKTLITNEFGTFNGSFVAPSAGLLGAMQINSNRGGTASAQVEEYKRPKFEVSFLSVTNSYKINDNIQFQGLAKAFAGNNIDGAKVKYRVVREVEYPYWRRVWWGYRRPPMGSGQQQIVTAETVTDKDGKFEINFKALPDRSVSKSTKAQFSYKIYADVTDINGETRSAVGNVSVGYIALEADISVPELINIKNLKSFALITNNLNGQHEDAKGTVVVHSLISPKKVFNERFWTKPDVFLMDKGEFSRFFPQYAYQNEDEIQNWKKKEKVFSSNFDSQKSNTIELGKLEKDKWEPGAYSVTLKTQDKFGENMEVTKYFTLYNLKDKLIPTNKNSFSVLSMDSHEPGDTAMIHIGTAADKIKVLLELERHGEIVNSQWIDITKFEHIDFPILEADRGNIHCHISYIKNNRAHVETQTVVVPWTNKDLVFEYATFRDKLLPGQEEEWKIKISGKKKDKFAAEMLAAMYDESLDQFLPHSWNLSLFPTSYASKSLQKLTFRAENAQLHQRNWYAFQSNFDQKFYDYLNWFGFPFYENMYRSIERQMDRGKVMKSAQMPEGAQMEMDKTVSGLTLSAANTASASPPPAEKVEDTSSPTTPKVDFSGVQIRKNLNETVFFMPNLMTDADGNIILKFKMNEALTRWKFLALAHTKDLKFGLSQKSIVTQKDLMIIPNPPRFLRESDQVEFTAKVNNLTKETLKGVAALQLFDAITNEPIDGLLENTAANILFTSEAGQSVSLAWNLRIPIGKVNAVTYKIIAKAGDFSDGEENTLPVLTNRMLVTESLPLPVRGGQKKTFTMESLKNSRNSNTLQNHKLTLEFTQNPAWYAVQALPYLMEYPYDCSEQIFSRFYANALASSAANSNPKIQNIFEKWKNTDALLSNLSKNQELKAALLEETPWVFAAQNEEAQKKNIGVLFDLQRMATEKTASLQKLAERQLSNGGFEWFAGGRDDWYITQYIVEGMGHLDKLNVTNLKNNTVYSSMLSRAVQYTDARFLEMYQLLEREVAAGRAKWENNNLNGIAVHYLYTRSFFKEIEKTSDLQKAHDYYLNQAKKYWNGQGIYMQGMIALALHRNQLSQNAVEILNSLKEKAINNEEFGMYWKSEGGYYWYELPLETHALLIETFAEISKDEKVVDDLKVWLIKNKQTSQWRSTKATASAVYALLLNGNNWLADDKEIGITLGGKLLDQSQLKKEAGTGYFKTNFEGKDVTPEMATVTVENPNSVVAWGAIYWQYFEQLDKIKSFKETPLTIVKKLFKEENSDAGPVIRLLSDSSEVKIGDKIVVRIEIRVDRPMEYIHMKDGRAAGFEPLNVISQYKWQGSLGYYESTRDASTSFFISYLPKGTHVFEYSLRVQQRGDFSNGITTLQSMYAPEFSSHSEGVRVKVK